MYNTLIGIKNRLDDLSADLRKEARVCAAELEDRQRLGLHGNDAIRHYNTWMRRYGLPNLIVPEDEIHNDYRYNGAAAGVPQR